MKNNILTICVLGIIAMMTGCSHTRCRVYVYNGTTEKITETKVILSSGESLSFGTLYPAIDKGIWPVVVTGGRDTLVEWMDAREAKKSATTEINKGIRDDSVIFLINANDTVTVQTGRKLFGPKKDLEDVGDLRVIP